MVKVINRRMRYGLRAAIADGFASLVAAGKPGSTKTTAGYVESSLLSQGWEIEETNGADEDGSGVWLSKLIPVKQIISGKEHDHAGPPQTKSVTKDEVLNMIDSMEEGEELDTFAKTLNNGEFLRQVQKHKPRRDASGVKELAAKFAAHVVKLPEAEKQKALGDYALASLGGSVKEYLSSYLAKL